MEQHFTHETKNIFPGGATLLEGVSVEVRPVEPVGVVGPNGAGKSVLRRALCGDTEPVRGEVSMCGRVPAEWSAIERASVRAVMPQESALKTQTDRTTF